MFIKIYNYLQDEYNLAIFLYKHAIKKKRIYEAFKNSPFNFDTDLLQELKERYNQTVEDYNCTKFWFQKRLYKI